MVGYVASFPKEVSIAFINSLVFIPDALGLRGIRASESISEATEVGRGRWAGGGIRGGRRSQGCLTPYLAVLMMFADPLYLVDGKMGGKKREGCFNVIGGGRAVFYLITHRGGGG